MSLAAVRHLREDDRLPSRARKLLSFTDNRQDASLQAGHFNDFVQVTLLRSALWRALDGSPSGIRHDELAQKVFEVLSLPRRSYALDPDLRGLARIDTDRALRGVLAYRLYRDLQRGWRLTQPNLEQAGLLVIEYESLADLVAADDMWTDCHPALAGCDPAKREFVLRVLLDWIRRELGLKVNVLDSRQQESLKRRAEQRLIGPWSLEQERLEYATEVLARPKSRGDSREWRYISSRGGFGQFVRRQNALGGVVPGRRLTLDDTTGLIEQMFERLRRYGLLLQVGADREGRQRWQIPAAALIWKAGDGTSPYQDHIRMPNAPDELPTNRYFVDLYRSVSTALVDIEAREHTAQVSYDQRLEREERFRSADLPVMFCSPTMELGVDISELNVVNLRNVPPTPANYSQRSGRAGRSGQPALVFTYCAAGNSHDQHFFREPERMIAGQVEAPRVDLANEDLIRAHVHSVWLSESGLNLGQSMGDVLDLADGVTRPELTAQIRDELHDPHSRARARSRAQVVLDDLLPDLREAPWWKHTWLDDVLRALPRRFEAALERWRTLYAAALTQAREQNRIATSATRSARDRRQARRLRAEAENQLEILRATSDHRGQSDFYTYRYFASEGFLPGYSFPRLPLSAFIPGRRGRYDQPEYLQRPRFLAISEFGPQTYIYHEGARYRINRVIFSSEIETGASQEADGPSVVTQRVKRCEHCGYMHRIGSPPGPDVCSYCSTELGATWTNLLRMRNVSTVRHDRITSDEEERRRLGYEVMSAVRFADREGRPSAARADVIAGSVAPGSEPLPLLNLTYGDTATIWRVNLGWRKRRAREQRGFILDVERGYWGKREDSGDPDDPMSPRTQRVIPYVTDTRNALLIQPGDPLDTETMASLEAALKAAMEVVFQLESSELATEPLPARDDRRLLLFYESAEGGAGVLRRLIDDPATWRRIARQALRRCHVDPDTGLLLPGDRAEPCEAACYDCLLTYRNQLDHGLLDREKVIPMLTRLLGAELSRSDDMDRLLVDSALEAAFLARLEGGGLPASGPFPGVLRGGRNTARLRLRRGLRGRVHRRSPPRLPRTLRPGSGRRPGNDGLRVPGDPLGSQRRLGPDHPGAPAGVRTRPRQGVPTVSFAAGSLVRARGREWVVLPESDDELVMVRPLGGADEEITGILTALEKVAPAGFALPDPSIHLGDALSARLLRDALRLGFRSSAGPFRSVGRIAVQPRPYQLVPLLMALRLDPVRLLIADDVGVGKTIEASLIARELLECGDARKLAVLCPPHLAEQWRFELASKFHIEAELVLSSTAARLERNLAVGQSLFDVYDHFVVSLDFIKSDRRRNDFIRACPELVIVDEAHTCASSDRAGRTRHQRHSLVSDLAEDPIASPDPGHRYPPFG